MKGIDKSTRLTNYLVDQLVILIIGTLISFVIGQTITPTPIYYIVYFLYYLLSETITRQTLGKKFTNTFVVDKKGRKPSFLRILQRSILRLIPIDPLSYLYGTENGLHDILSATQIQRKEKTVLRKV